MEKHVLSAQYPQDDSTSINFSHSGSLAFLPSQNGTYKHALFVAIYHTVAFT